MKSASALRSADIDRPSAPPRQPLAKQHLTTRGSRVALSTAFGLPFVYSLGAALRGELFVGRYYFFGGTSSMATFVAWTVVSALAHGLVDATVAAQNDQAAEKARGPRHVVAFGRPEDL